MERTSGQALEEELIGLSLTGEKPISPRTIKRPTNPVATCLEATTTGLLAAPSIAAGLDGPLAREEGGGVAKRPRLDGEMSPWPLQSVPMQQQQQQQQQLAPGGISHQPSPPSLSPLIAGGGRFATSSRSVDGPAPSTQASPTSSHSVARPLEPRPVHVAGPFAALDGGGHGGVGHGGVSPAWSHDDPMSSEVPPGYEAMGAGADPRIGRPFPEPHSPVAVATNSIHLSLRLGPPGPQPPKFMDAACALPPSIDGMSDAPMRPAPLTAGGSWHVSASTSFQSQPARQPPPAFPPPGGSGFFPPPWEPHPPPAGFGPTAFGPGGWAGPASQSLSGAVPITDFTVRVPTSHPSSMIDAMAPSASTFGWHREQQQQLSAGLTGLPASAGLCGLGGGLFDARAHFP